MKKNVINFHIKSLFTTIN